YRGREGEWGIVGPANEDRGIRRDDNRPQRRRALGPGGKAGGDDRRAAEVPVSPSRSRRDRSQRDLGEPSVIAWWGESLRVRRRGTLGACLITASLVTSTSASTKRRAARWVTTGTAW